MEEKLNEKQPQRALQRYSKTVKIITIGVLCLLLLIPMAMIKDLIRERDMTQDAAIQEVSDKWSRSQTITGPYLSFQYPVTIEDEGKQKTVTKNLVLFPDDLFVEGELKTEVLKRGIYEVNVYQSDVILSGSFSSKELIKSKINVNQLQPETVAVCLNLSDMRGITEQISLLLGDSIYVFEPGMDYRGIEDVGVHTLVNLSGLMNEEEIPYEIKLHLKGSESIFFVPIGKTSQIKLKANWDTPSFTGNYLPKERNVTGQGFVAEWQVLNLNRNYSQVITNFSRASLDNIMDSGFGVKLKIPVEQYQQAMRSAKYAILIILLTFAIIFFTEIVNDTRIHALQYLLVGLALCLFYSLLLSFSEHLGFNMAYLLAAILTIALVGGYMFGIMKKRKPALIMTGLLSLLYLYIFTLIQLETYALLVGSLGLFIILGIVMYFSKKINWFNE
ncbi:MAG: cell envelope integrity protein CreD [Bacteroidales bacterium]|nr:cell envelope integrity protein CreD [Bacteroidales bacterium]